jgi:hypothetical protein
LRVSFDESACKLLACYGRPLGDAPDDLYPAPGKLDPDQIDAVIAYLQARIIGRGEITRQECISYYEGFNSELCEDLPVASNLAEPLFFRYRRRTK